MPLSNEQITNQVIKPALSEIADFTGDIEDFTTANFQALHISTFMDAVQRNVRAVQVVIDGTPYPNSMYDIDLNQGIFDSWTTIGNAISYVQDNQALGPRH